jgi:hypothetical protein
MVKTPAQERRETQQAQRHGIFWHAILKEKMSVLKAIKPEKKHHIKECHTFSRQNHLEEVWIRLSQGMTQKQFLDLFYPTTVLNSFWIKKSFENDKRFGKLRHQLVQQSLIGG